MEKNVKAARIHRGLSWFYGLLTALFLYPAIVSLVSPRPEQPEKVTAIFFAVAIFCGFVFLLHHITAKGAREKQSWARNTSIGIAIFMLLGFPIGTFIGIYLLSNTWNSWDA